MSEEKEIKSFSVEYTDETVKTFEKGFMAEIKEDNDTVSFSMAGMRRRDLGILVLSVIELGDKLGMFDKQRE